MPEINWEVTTNLLKRPFLTCRMKRLNNQDVKPKLKTILSSWKASRMLLQPTQAGQATETQLYIKTQVSQYHTQTIKRTKNRHGSEVLDTVESLQISKAEQALVLARNKAAQATITFLLIRSRLLTILLVLRA